MRAEIRKEVAAIKPLDELEACTISEVLEWIASGAELCRIDKPANPPKHLVAYFPLVDGDYVLLVDHINAEKWLPPGGHVEPHEHPRDTAMRECSEELRIAGQFAIDGPVLITSTETVGRTAGHIDVSIWYAMKGDRAARMRFDPGECRDVKWFHRDGLPHNTDPHLGRFVEKLYGASR